MHIGLKGTMNAIFLNDLAAKTRRCQRGRVEKGRSGGRSGIWIQCGHRAGGWGGARAINEDQARVKRGRGT